jgi:hypothetical protein
LRGYAVVSLIHKYHWEGLVQLHNGMERAAAKPPDQQTPGNWVVFSDAATGVEVWQLDGDESPGTVQIPGVLNRTPWNRNGQHFVLSSDRCLPNRLCGDTHQFLYNADGSFARPIVPRDTTRTPRWTQNVELYGYAPWDTFDPNVLYYPTWNDSNHRSLKSPQSSVYAINIVEGDLATKIVDLPNPAGRKTVQSYLTGDDVLMVQDANPDITKGEGSPRFVVKLYMVDVRKKKLLYSYPIGFGLSAPDHKRSEEYHLHDIYFRRNAADTYIFNYGPRSVKGESVFFEMPLNGDAAHGRVVYPDAETATPYYSHPAWNHDGSLVAYEGESVLGNDKWGVWVRNNDAHKTLAYLGASANHIGWDGYDPNYVVYDGWTGPGSYDVSHATTDGRMSGTLVQLPPREPEHGPSMLVGPAQSPDATKVMFTAPLEFVAGAKMKTYIAVDHRPFAPAITVTSTSPMILHLTPYLTTRELKGYRVYRSSRLTAGFKEISNGIVTASSFKDTSAASHVTYFYAVTAEENSGLESSQPSVVKVTIGGRSSAMSWPSGQRFYTTPPSAPATLTAASSVPGVWSLSWTPSTSTNVRYYNIYYATSEAPSATQAYLVASVPAGKRTFTYWLADASAPAHYAITAVDRQENMSIPRLSQ